MFHAHRSSRATPLHLVLLWQHECARVFQVSAALRSRGLAEKSGGMEGGGGALINADAAASK